MTDDDNDELQRMDKLIEDTSREQKEGVVLLCPKCYSTEIMFWLGSYAGKIYQCKDCSYRGPFVIEKEMKEKKGSCDI